MAGIACDTCGRPLRVEVTGCNFNILEGSTLDHINFEKVEDTQIITTLDEPNKSSLENDNALTVNVVCTKDREHGIFATTVSKVKVEIYGRMMIASRNFIRKYS